MAPKNERPRDGNRNARLEAVLVLLLGRYGFARCSGYSLWSCALDLATLTQLGVDEDTLRAALTQHLVITRPELVTFADEGDGAKLTGWHAQTLFALTEAGAMRAWRAVSARLNLSADASARRAGEQASGQRGPRLSGGQRDRSLVARGRVKPRWDRRSRTLWYGEILVLHFRREASNQMRILDAFQELCWPARIDDPLPSGGGVDRRERLYETIRSLNAGQDPLCVHFHMEANGQGVCWSVVEA